MTLLLRGRHTRDHPSPSYRTRVGQNRFRVVSRSVNFVITVNWSVIKLRGKNVVLMFDLFSDT